MTIRSSMLSKLTVMTLVLGLLMQLNVNGKMSWANVDQDIVKQTVPTRTPTPQPNTPTVPPPTATHTPEPPPTTDTPEPPPTTDTPEPPMPSATPEATAGVAILTVKIDTNVFSGPGYEYAVLGSFKKGSTAVVVGQNADSSWWQIVFLESVGWISDTDVTPSKAAYDVPVVNTTSAAVEGSSPSTLPLAGGSSWPLLVGALLIIIGALLLLVGLRSRWPKPYA